MAISGFTTTLMMVGILSFPIEKTYFGFRVALVRNIVSLLIALTVEWQSAFTSVRWHCEIRQAYVHHRAINYVRDLCCLLAHLRLRAGPSNMG